jgi:deazaflavin-dependent oxidoreductase (nitroreductase family)
MTRVPDFDDVPKGINQIIAAHIKLYLEHPEQAHMWDSAPVGVPGPVPTLLLTTVGRKTGKPRHAPLLYVDDNGTYLVIASKGGNADDPIWYLNLQDNPECEIRVSSFRSKARATVLQGEQRERAWKTITDRHSVYLKYQGRAERQIPVVRLEPIRHD